jgi:RNA polymerase sigma-70 factor (ECF subfamily)
MKASDFNRIVLPIQEKIFRLSRRLLVSSDAAQDATQDVLIKLWDKKESLTGIHNVEAFAMTMTKNHCLDQLRLKRNQNLRLVHSNFENDEANPQQQLEAKQELKTVEKLMEKLPENQKMILHMRQIEGYEYNEICEIMEMNATAVRVALSRARKTLVEELSKIKEYEKRKQN